jgi:predicted chitinase
MAFISGGVGAGMGGIGGGGIGGAIVRGAASSAISQGIGVALGLQDKFNWAAVAAAGVANAATQALSIAGSSYKTIGGKQTRIAGSSWVERANHQLAAALGGGALAGQMSDAIVGAGVGLVAAMPGAAAQSLIAGSDFGDNLRAALPSITANMLASGVLAMLENACFVAGTQVQTVTGLKAIEDLKPGDWVYARAESGDDPTIHRRQILETYRFEDKATLTLAFATASGPYTVTTTGLHPFYVEGQGWTAAHDLVEGDSIQLMDGGVSILQTIETETRLSTVFNFAVDVDHTYFIGDAGLWVHNTYRNGELKVQIAAGLGREPGYSAGVEGYNYVTPEQLVEGLGIDIKTARARAPYLNDSMYETGIDSWREQAAYLAQTSVETGGYKDIKDEDFSYSKTVALAKFSALSSNPQLVNKLWTTNRYLAPGQFEEFANFIYADANRSPRTRLGNTQKGDGWRFHGRGYIQVTGRENYGLISRVSGIDFLSNPDWVNDPRYASRAGAAFFVGKSLDRTAQAGKIREVTARVATDVKSYALRDSSYYKMLNTLSRIGK